MITSIIIKTIIKANNDKEFLIWAQDDNGRHWKREYQTASGSYIMYLGIPELYEAVPEQTKDWLIEELKKCIEEHNSDYKRVSGMKVISETIEILPIYRL